MSRVYNFSAGPAVLPEEVLKEVADEMMDYNGTGMSVMEMSHRSAAFQEIIDTAEKHRNTEKRTRLLLPRIRPSPTFRIAAIFRSARMQTMFISVRTTPFMEPSSKSFQIQRAKHLWQMYPPVSFPSRLM